MDKKSQERESHLFSYFNFFYFNFLIQFFFYFNFLFQFFFILIFYLIFFSLVARPRSFKVRNTRIKTRNDKFKTGNTGNDGNDGFKTDSRPGTKGTMIQDRN